MRGGHAYEFGVSTGGSLAQLRAILEAGTYPRLKWRRIAPLSAPATRFFAFDSFRGLPPSDVEAVPMWRRGAFSFDPRAWLVARHFNRTGGPRVTFVEGFYNESLRDELVRRHRMSPATYVNIDCDLYESARAALDFLLRNGLLVPGSLVGYDDWWAIPCGEGVRSLAVSEGRAHAELAARHDVEFLCVAGPCRYQPAETGGARPNLFSHYGAWGVVFLVLSVGQRRAHHGFAMTEEEEGRWRAAGEANRGCARLRASGRAKFVAPWRVGRAVSGRGPGGAVPRARGAY